MVASFVSPSAASKSVAVSLLSSSSIAISLLSSRALLLSLGRDDQHRHPYRTYLLNALTSFSPW